jgi:hypothetical protein
VLDMRRNVAEFFVTKLTGWTGEKTSLNFLQRQEIFFVLKGPDRLLRSKHSSIH